MNEQNSVKILWLSDIHFKNAYTEERIRANTEIDDPARELQLILLPRLDDLLASFHRKVAEYIDELAENGDRLDYILISGDLAFSGSETDYQLFEEKLLAPLKALAGTGARVLAIPGNHDVNWGKSDFLNRFLSGLADMSEDELKKRYLSYRKDFLLSKADHFRLIFSRYTEYFLQHILPTLNHDHLSQDYRKDGLYGMIIDKEKNLVINLFNSAWFALGEKFDTLLLREMLTEAEVLQKKSAESSEKFNEKFSKIINELITLKTAATEYGEQILGHEIMPEREIIHKLEEHAGYFTLTCFHHPPNWLQYATKYNLESSNHDELFFNQVLRHTDLLLTGHEHVPSSSLPEKINREIYHLKAGMFMQDNMLAEGIEGEHRFSILEIDTVGFRFSEKKYVYDFKEKDWLLNKKSLALEEVPKKDHKFIGAKLPDLLARIKEPDILKKILEQHFLEKDEIDKLEPYPHCLNENYLLFVLKKNAHVTKMVVLPINHLLFGSVLPANSITDYNEPHGLDPIIRATLALPGCRHISFITPDFLIESPDSSSYRSSEEATESSRSSFTYIVKKADFIFNKARHHFFNRFERKKTAEPNNNDLVINEIQFERIREICLSNQVIPFWIIEKYV